jgi:endonuclease/exonuclease/phosphatase family metal-dependent hydrolase
VKVLTFNIMNGAIGREYYGLEIFRALDPDLILLQEVTDPDVVRDWATELKMNFVLAKGYTFRRVTLLSRYPILSWHSHTPFPKLSRDFLEVIIEPQPNQTITVFCLHCAAQPFVLYEWFRLWELRSIIRRAKRYQTTPCLIAGDFNSVAPGDNLVSVWLPPGLRPLMRLQGNRYLRAAISLVLRSGFVDCYRRLHSDAGFTFPPPAPTIRFDYIFVNAYFSQFLQTCFVIDYLSAVNRASDHYPLMAVFSLW